MNFNTCIICFADDIEVIEYLKMPLDQAIVLTNQYKEDGAIQTEVFSLETLDNILNYKQHINKFIITQNLNCAHELIVNILNKLVIHSKIIYNYHPITLIENETLELISRKNGSTFNNYAINSEQVNKQCLHTPQCDVPIVFFVHSSETLSMAYYMSNVTEIFQENGYKVKHITNSILYDLLNATLTPSFLYDFNISNTFKSACFKDYLTELSLDNIDAIVCSLDFYETMSSHEGYKCSRDLVEELIYICQPDYLAIGLLDNLCNQIFIDEYTTYMRNRCNVECDIFVQTPYINNPNVGGIGYYRLKYDDMSNNRLENVISVNNANCFDQLYSSIINKLSNRD